MDRYILILTDTFEEVEALTQVDYLRRADIKVDMISITGKLQVTSNRGITVLADDLFENINLKMEKLKVENKWKLIIYENIKTSYIKDYNLDTEETLYCDILLEKLKIEPLYDKI